MKRIRPGDKIPAHDYNKAIDFVEAFRVDDRSAPRTVCDLYGYHPSNIDVPAYSLLEPVGTTGGTEEGPILSVTAPYSASPNALFTNGPYNGVGGSANTFPLFPLTYGAPFKVAVPSSGFSALVGSAQIGPVVGDFKAGNAGKGLVCLSPVRTGPGSAKWVWAALSYTPATSSTRHAKSNPSGIPPKLGLQMGGSLGSTYACSPTGLLSLDGGSVFLYNPSTGPISGNADVVYSVNTNGLAIVVVEDCALGDCADALPVITSTGPYTKETGVVTTITFAGTGTILNWTVGGSIPPGYAVLGTGGSKYFQGTLTTPGTYSVTLTATNCAGSATVTISIEVTSIPVVIP